MALYDEVIGREDMIGEEEGGRQEDEEEEEEEKEPPPNTPRPLNIHP